MDSPVPCLQVLPYPSYPLYSCRSSYPCDSPFNTFGLTQVSGTVHVHEDPKRSTNELNSTSTRTASSPYMHRMEGCM